jgi:hypothetical protein
MVMVEGEERVLCYFGLLRIAKWEPSDIAPLKELLSAQAAYHAGAA